MRIGLYENRTHIFTTASGARAYGYIDSANARKLSYMIYMRVRAR